mmetsp:Transcript_20280/g.25012  ORF Transcript_20280/g.25012 Transcript_20280/m.25012 type:complete len:159 (-) Transcript_20280:36-512(-)
MINALKRELRNELKNNEPVLVREMTSADKLRRKGWSKIRLNDCDSKDNDISLSNNGTVKLKPNTYIVQAMCNTFQGEYSVILLQSSNESIKIYGNIGYSYSNSASSSAILPQKIRINQNTELSLYIYVHTSAGRVERDPSVTFDGNKCHVTSLSIQKL